MEVAELDYLTLLLAFFEHCCVAGYIYIEYIEKVYIFCITYISFFRFQKSHKGCLLLYFSEQKTDDGNMRTPKTEGSG